MHEVRLAVLAEDADGEVAQAGHGAGQSAGADLAERAVPHVVQEVLDAPVAFDPSRFVTGSSAASPATTATHSSLGAKKASKRSRMKAADFSGGPWLQSTRRTSKPA